MRGALPPGASNLVGARIKLICTTDEYTKVKPGAEGTVRYVDALGTVHVCFDDGTRLGLIRRAGDRFRLIGPSDACPEPYPE
jgi:Domain of unknown function (DUF4314)